MVVPSSGQLQATGTFCDLLRNPDKYNGKEVTVRATYRYGFEWQQLYCLDCVEKGRAWLEIPGDGDESLDRSLRRTPKAGIVNLTVQGLFLSGSTYGHMNGYSYQITAHKISSVVVLLKGIKSREEEQRVEKRWACGGTNPK